MITSYFGTKPTPWAKTNAVFVKNALTSAEALKTAKLDFDVLQEPVFDSQMRAIEGYRVNRKSDDGTILGMVTPRYKVVQNTDAFAFTDGLIGAGRATYENAGSCNNWTTVWLQARLEPRYILGDKYDNFLFFKNSFDGKGAVKVCVTPVRIICQNMLNPAVRRAKRTFSIRHTGDIAGKIKEADMTLRLSEEYLTEVNTEYVRLARIRLNAEKVNRIWEQLFPISKEAKDREVRNAETNRGIIRDCYNADDIGNFRGTGFGVLNAVSDMVSHPIPLRTTDSFYGNLFDKVTNGHPLLDKAQELVYAMAE